MSPADRVPVPALAGRPAFRLPTGDLVLAPVYLPASVLPRPRLDYDARRGVWYLAAPYALTLTGYRLRIPAGFTLDLSSVPRILWPLLASHELGLVPPVVHDALYQCAGRLPPGWVDPPRVFTRSEADELFAWAMKMEGVDEKRRRLAYRAVRRFGASAWRTR